MSNDQVKVAAKSINAFFCFQTLGKEDWYLWCETVS